jgi:hypothetical protein
MCLFKFLLQIYCKIQVQLKVNNLFWNANLCVRSKMKPDLYLATSWYSGSYCISIVIGEISDRSFK